MNRSVRGVIEIGQAYGAPSPEGAALLLDFFRLPMHLSFLFRLQRNRRPRRAGATLCPLPNDEASTRLKKFPNAVWL